MLRRVEKKKENKYRFAFPQMEGSAISSHGTFHSTFLEPRDFFRVDTYKQLCQRPGSSRHPISPLGGLEGWWHLGHWVRPGEGWFIFKGFSFDFQFLPVMFFLPDVPMHFYIGVKGWERLPAVPGYAGGFGTMDFVALVSCAFSLIEVIKKPRIVLFKSVMSFTQSQTF